MTLRGGFLGQIFPYWALKGQSPLAPITRAYLPYVPLVVILGLVASLVEGIGIGLLIPLVSLLLVDSLPAGLPKPLVELAALTSNLDRESRILALGGAIMGFIVVKGIIQAANNALIINIDGRLGRDIRNALCARILQLDYAFFLRNDSPRLVQIITTDCWFASEAFRAALTMTPAAVALTVFGGILLWLDWRLTMIVLAAAVVIQSMLFLIERLQRRLGLKVTQNNHRLWERMLTVVSVIRAIRIFGQYERELALFERASEKVRQALFRIRRVTYSVVPLVDVMTSVLLLTVLLAAYRLGLAIPAMTAYIVLLMRAQPYAHSISRARVEFASLAASVEQVEWLLGQHPAAESLAGSRRVETIDRPIRFESVSYCYPDGTPALDDVSVVLRPGVATALIGKSGAGKSSFVDLLCRLVEPQRGAIHHGDEPIRTVDPEEWRSRMAIAEQKVEMVDGTIAENIAYGSPQATTEEIEEAARAAMASGFIAALPKGYETRLGVDGLKLSAGERQRIGVARALLRRPDLLILDEATSAVDAFSEQEIMKLLREKQFFRSALVISHRRSTLALCEDGIVLDHGKLVEAGPLRQLDYYRSMTGDAE